MTLNLFQVLPDTFIQESLSTRDYYENLDKLFVLDNEVRLALLDLTRLRKLKLFYGIVYAFGYNGSGQLGTGNTDNVYEIIPTPTEIIFSTIVGKRVIQVAAGDYHSLILCEDGTVYSFGENRFGQLGNGTSGDNMYVAIPTPIDISNIGSRKVIQVSAGIEHSLLLCEDGTVFSFGYNEFSQLGTGNTNNVAIPTAINTLNIGSKRVIHVSAGGRHSLILCEDGSVYSFGWNMFGQSGNGRSGYTDDVAIPTAINTTKMGGNRVIQVSAGGSHSLILCEDGTVFSFGWNMFGQLGNGRSGNTNNVAIPTAINTSKIGSKRIIQVSAGDRHSLILCEDGSVYTFSQNGAIVNIAIPTINIGSKKVIQVSAGDSYSLILCEDGSVYSFGLNEDGQLGTGNTDDVRIPTPIDTTNIGSKRVIQVSAGGRHSLLLT